MCRLFVFLCTSACSLCLAQQEIVHTIELPKSGVGRTDTPLGSFIDVKQTDDGFIVEQFVSAADADNERLQPHRAIDFQASFHQEGWVRFTFDQFVESRWISLDFAPFGEVGGVSGGVGRSWRLAPVDNLPEGLVKNRSFHVSWEGGCGGEIFCRDVTTFFEYSVVPIEPPLPADFNFDDKIDGEDFLILSDNFRARSVKPLFHRGDATLNGRVEFDDFLILSANYGAVREPPAAAVPEPVSALLGMALLGIGAFRRRR